MPSYPGDHERSLVYIANSRIPSQRTNSLQVMKMCAAFSDAGAATELIIPFRFREWLRLTTQGSNIRDWYAVDAPFSVTSLLYPYLSKRSRMACYAASAALYARYRSPDLVYTRNLRAADQLSAWKQPVVFEAHDLAKERTRTDWRRVVDEVMRRPAFRGLVAISRGLADAYLDAGAPPEKLRVFHDGVDLNRFTAELDRETARSRLHLSGADKVVCHVGNMSAGRGVDVLIRAQTGLSGVILMLVGGRTEEIERYRRQAVQSGVSERIRFVGYVSNKRVPLYLQAADVLVMAATADSPIASYTSPLKMFEYMASGRPVVATKLATIGEVLRHRENALLARPGDPDSLRESIQQLLADPLLGERLARQAQADVRQYGWARRAAAILAAFAHGI